MITLHPISAGSGIDYLLRTVASGDVTIGRSEAAAYWASGGDTPGRWLGSQAAALGLRGQVSQEAADALFKDGVDPTNGRPLGRVWPRYPTVDEHLAALLGAEPNASAARREQLREQAEKVGNRTARSGWEMVFSPVKSFAVLWGTANDATRARLEEVERAAFRRVFARVEREACWTRSGPGGVVQLRGEGLIAAGFEHRSSRAGDPDWHRHVAISTKVRTEDGRWLALDARHLHRLVVSLSAQYTAEIERGMFEEFGVLAAPRTDTIRQDKRPVREFLGVSDVVVRAFSARRAQTERNLTALLHEFRQLHGREPSRPEEYELAQRAALTARPDKQVHGVEEEREQWRARARELGVRRPRRWLVLAWRASRAAARQHEITPLPEVVERVLVTLEGDRESWTRANAEAETYRQLVAAGWHLRSEWGGLVDRVVEHVLHPDRCELISPPEPVPVPARYLRPDGTPVFVQHGAARYTSHRLRATEMDLVEAARRPAPVRRLTTEQVDAALAAGDVARGFGPSAEQRQIVRAVFTGDTRVQAVTGGAGTGKTTIMALVREVADAHGIPVLGLAGGQVQADNLAEKAGIRAENLARWRFMSEVYAPGAPQWTLPAGAIVIVDEAGQAATGDLHAVLGQVADAGGRLLPIGDPCQLGAPGAGGALDLIASDAGALRLTEVRRFRNADGTPRRWEVEAARALSAGDGDAAWTAYASRGRLHEGSLDALLEQAYTAWCRDTAEGLTSILLTPTNALAAKLSHVARTARVEAGLVDDTTTIDLADGNRAGAGDQLVTRANDRRLTCHNRTRQYVRNGDIWTVVSVTEHGDLDVRHSLTGGRVTLPRDYCATAAELGYAITHTRAQGVTVHTGHALIVPGMDRNSAYPALTRGSLENHGYLVCRDQVDVESGEPAPDRTGRRLWAAVVAADGTQLSATAQQRAALDEADSLRTHEPRLRQVLRDIAEAETIDAIARLLGPAAARQLSSAPAWPALHAQLLQLAEAGIDTDRLLKHTYFARDFLTRDGAPVDDAAAIVHARNRRALDPAEGGSPDAFRQEPDAPTPTTAAGYETAPAADPTDVLAAVGLRLPEPAPHDDRRTYAHALARQLHERAAVLAEQAQRDANAGTGWAAAYGPEPTTVPDAVAWRDRLAAAAAYRDLADYQGTDPTGPAPLVEDGHLRGLWRAAQRPTDEPTPLLAARLAARAPAWLDALGPRPGPGDRLRPGWDEAAQAIATYRTLWNHAAEHVALGTHPTEPVQAADYRRASRTIARWRLATPPTTVRPDLTVARGQAGAAHSAAAQEAADRWHAADQAATRALQRAEDATNRAAAAAASANSASAHADAAELLRRAAQARHQADHAVTEREAARRHVERLAPGLLTARTDARRAADLRRRQAQRAAADARLRDAYYRRPSGPDVGRDPHQPESPGL
ncbi:MobF family relaxase [Streptomyces millisiae]|uniref:MobF family relaxase n=1 Tax=Streptomyces millisiae TaxID=3075542 RepID=A0ABU2LNZ5_9ACTN|nr:MobF family relaxase [Streptomyces sp. DSM 44918]MDT0319314.1 MobF family relaxase [Streptomyces sp. DSM 44918]